MTKPHEETWKTGEGALAGALYSGDTWIGSFTNADRARLAVEAPMLAVALLTLGRYGWRGAYREWHLGVCWNTLCAPDGECLHGCRDARRVLTCAGVLE